MSNLSDLLPAGSSGKTFSATASGAISSKKGVILNSAGTVSQVSKPTTNQAVGSRQAMYHPSSGQGPGIFSMYVYHEASGYMCAIYQTTGTVIAVKTGIPQSDNTITWGTEYTFSQTYLIATAAYDSQNEKIIVAQRNSSGYVAAITVSSSGVPSISSGWQSNSDGNVQGHAMLCFCPTQNVMILHYQKSSGDVNRVRTINCADASASNWVWGTATVVSSTSPSGNYYGDLKWDTANEKALLIYHENGKAKQCVISVTGTSGSNITVSSNADATFAYSSGTHTTPDMTMSYDESREKFVLFYRDPDASHYPHVSVGTISGTSISWNTKVAWKSARTLGHNSAYFAGGYHSDNTVGTVICTWTDDGAGGIEGTYPHMTNFVVNSSGNVSNYSSTTQMDSGYYYDSINGNDDEHHQQVCVDTAQKRFVAGYRRYKTTSNSAITPRLIDTWIGHPTHTKTTLTTDNFLGIADAAISNSASGDVVVRGGTITGLSSLTVGSNYYVSTSDGSLSTTAGTPSVKAGKAISTSSIVMTGES